MIYTNSFGQFTIEIEQQHPHNPRIKILRKYLKSNNLITEDVVEVWWTDRWWVRVGELGRRIPIYEYNDALALTVQVCSLIATPEELEWISSYAVYGEVVELFRKPVVPLNTHPEPRIA